MAYALEPDARRCSLTRDLQDLADAAGRQAALPGDQAGQGAIPSAGRCQITPSIRMDSATRTKPAMFAPST